MRVIANMVVRNEEERYLDSCLAWLGHHVDEIFITDDRSTDDTVGLAIDHGATVYTRGDDEPSFLEAEGLFRAISWQRMLETFQPTSSDWVLGIDADEYPVCVNVRTVCDEANRSGYGSINIKIPEIFSINPLAERVDGFWGGIVGTRLARYVTGPQEFRQAGMGSGMFPSYAYSCRNWNERDDCGLRILHFGYADPLDRQEKYDRYTNQTKSGHAGSHIESILQTPKLKDWDGPAPSVWRGWSV